MYSEIDFFRTSDFEVAGNDPKIIHSIEEQFELKYEPTLVIKFSPDSKLLAVGFENNRIMIYNISDNFSKI